MLRKGARDLLAQAVEAEVGAWIEDHAGVVDGDGHRRVVRNGRLPARKILIGGGSCASSKGAEKPLGRGVGSRV